MKKTTVITFKNGMVKVGRIIEFNPDDGDTSVIFIDDLTNDKLEIPLQEMESCITKRVEVQCGVFQDVDQLQRAVEAGWQADMNVSFAGLGRLLDKEGRKEFRSKHYNYSFDKETGFFARWGKTENNDPLMSVFGPEIADIEISTVCHGIHNKPCKFCYKSNTGKGKNMTLDTFERLFYNLPKSLTQIAFGIGDIDANPDLWAIFRHCRRHGVVPNVTINGDRATDQDFDKLAALCGAVAVSRYNPPDVCYDAVYELTRKRGMEQVNIHMLLSQETYEDCLQLIEDACTDPRLEDLNAIVFLALKERGRGTCMHSLRDTKKYKKLVEKAFKSEVAIGFDSCSAPTFLKSVEGMPNYEELYQLSEPCESTLFSIYVDVDANVWPCSFLENEEYEPVNLLEVENFMNDCWLSEKLNAFRRDLLGTTKCQNCLVAGVRECPKYNLYRE